MIGRPILIVDDEAKMRRVLEIMLQKLGHRVFGASNGREALEIFGSHAVDLVIVGPIRVDVQRMPPAC